LLAERRRLRGFPSPRRFARHKRQVFRRAAFDNVVDVHFELLRQRRRFFGHVGVPRFEVRALEFEDLVAAIRLRAALQVQLTGAFVVQLFDDAAHALMRLAIIVMADYAA
jgi:hypothetical protein